MTRIIALTALVGCGSPTHLQYDHGRASSQAFAAQGNLARPEAVDAAIPMQGPEALKIRESVHEKATDENSGKPEVVKDIGVN